MKWYSVSFKQSDNYNSFRFKMYSALQELYKKYLAGDICGAEVVKGTTEDMIYYINPDTGSDSNTGTNAEPFEHIQHAIDLLPKVLRHHAIILLQDSLNYNEQVVIEGFVKLSPPDKYFGIYSLSYNPTKVLLTSPVDAYEAISIRECSAPVYIGYISVRVQKDSGACFSIRKGNADLWNCRVADNDNLNTKGIMSRVLANVYVHNCADYDGKKVTKGLYAENGGRIGYTGSPFGDTATEVVSGGLITDGIILKKAEYDAKLSENGISGSFTTTDGKTITVVDGQITSIV